jgi:NAD(P)-dependent dehydrogenase (short-subunit alcohol dehydrogenase family)
MESQLRHGILVHDTTSHGGSHVEFENKRILITGSTRGIGRSLAAYFLREGARVAIHGRSQARVREVIGELGAGARLVEVSGDLIGADGCARVVTQAVDGLGGLDVLVNNAGVFDIASIENTDEALWDAAMDTNVKAAFFCSRAALSALRLTKGNIVNHSSIAGLIGLANVAAYCASKGAVLQLTRAMAMELAPDVRVNCVCPTTVDNEMGWKGFNRSDDPQAAYQAFVAASKMKRMATNADVVRAIAFLASDRSGFMTGVALPVDGGKSAGV